MTNLGRWAPYVDECEMYSWYGMPSSIAIESQTYKPDGRELEPLSNVDFAALRSRTIRFVNSSVLSCGPAYHGPEHFATVEGNAVAAINTYERSSGQKIPLAIKQSFSLAAYSHDAFHPGSTLRVDARRGLWMPQLGKRVATEWVTMIGVNHFMRTQGLPLPARLFQSYLILSTTYGGATPRGKQLGIPVPQPRTIWGTIIRASDACPSDKFEDWLRLTIAVNYGETPASPAPRTWIGFVGSGTNFANYVQLCMDQMDSAAGFPLSTQLGWRKRLHTLRSGVSGLRDRSGRMAAVAQNELAKFGVTLS